MATNCLKSILVKGHLILSTHHDSVLGLIEVIDIWIQRKLMCSLQESPYFSILADEWLDISTQDELSICGRWLVNGKPEEHFLMVFHVHSTDAGSIAEAFAVLLTAEET